MLIIENHPKAAWPMVRVPKTGGGLNVINLRVQNESLLLKYLHKFYSHMDIPCVQLVWRKYYAANRLPALQGPQRGSFWWRDVLKLLQQFKGISVISLQNGATCLHWHDLWEGNIWSQTFPELFSFCKNSNITFQSAIQAQHFQDLFHLPLSRGPCPILETFLDASELQPEDIWTYI